MAPTFGWKLLPERKGNVGLLFQWSAEYFKLLVMAIVWRRYFFERLIRWSAVDRNVGVPWINFRFALDSQPRGKYTFSEFCWMNRSSFQLSISSIASWSRSWGDGYQPSRMCLYFDENVRNRGTLGKQSTKRLEEQIQDVTGGTSFPLRLPFRPKRAPN